MIAGRLTINTHFYNIKKILSYLKKKLLENQINLYDLWSSNFYNIAYVPVK
jgi:hypothetical protein